jgi:preprotein translocase subunit YajC
MIPLASLPSFLPLAQTSTAEGGGPPGFVMLGYVVIFGVMFYFLLIRPQQKQKRQMEDLVKSIKTGDKVIAAGGIVGIVSNVKDETILLKVADNVKIEVQKLSVTLVTKPSASDTAAATPAS